MGSGDSLKHWGGPGGKYLRLALVEHFDGAKQPMRSSKVFVAASGQKGSVEALPPCFDVVGVGLPMNAVDPFAKVCAIALADHFGYHSALSHVWCGLLFVVVAKIAQLSEGAREL